MKSNEMEKLVNYIKEKNLDITQRTVPFRGGKVLILYIAQLTDRPTLAQEVVRPLILQCSQGKARLTAQGTLDEIIYADSCKIGSGYEKILDLILSGMVVVLFTTDDNYIIVNLKKVAQRSIPTPQLTYTLRGPQDCFTENLDSNLSLIRYRVKDEKLRIKFFEVGVRTKERVAVTYIEDIANDTVIGEVQKRIDNINVDAIGESGELQAFLLNDNSKLFPVMGLIERSDMACYLLMEGKVVVLVDGSEFALSAPMTFQEFLYSCDDRYDNKYFGMLARFLRFAAIAIALTASSVYVAITSFHTEVLPGDYAISLAQMNANVPFSSLVGALILEFIMELLREALIRVPKQIGPAIGIVGAIVIGQAAIAAGFFSPVLLTIAAVSLLSSFAIPDYTLVNPFRILKFALLMFTGAMGFLGFTAFLTALGIHLVSLNSFGVPYLAPWMPFDRHEFARTLINQSDTARNRHEYLKTKDRVRLRKSRGDDRNH